MKYLSTFNIKLQYCQAWAYGIGTPTMKQQTLTCDLSRVVWQTKSCCSPISFMMLRTSQFFFGSKNLMKRLMNYRHQRTEGLIFIQRILTSFISILLYDLLKLQNIFHFNSSHFVTEAKSFEFFQIIMVNWPKLYIKMIYQ